jgi:dihydrofolate reductase
MRKVVLQMQTSLDLYVCRPNRELDFVEAGFDVAVMAFMNEGLSNVDTMLLGRTAFLEQQGFWPTDAAKDDPLTPQINAWEKVVFSKTLTDADVVWPNSRIVSGDLATKVQRLKALDGKDILVSGGSSFAQSMSAQGLVDEYRLAVHPVAIGAGLPLFGSQVDLQLVESHPLANGVVGVVYTAKAR